MVAIYFPVAYIVVVMYALALCRMAKRGEQY